MGTAGSFPGSKAAGPSTPPTSSWPDKGTAVAVHELKRKEKQRYSATHFNLGKEVVNPTLRQFYHLQSTPVPTE
jgi:hypothetical protein